MTYSPLPTLLVNTQGRANKRVHKNADVRACSAFTGGIDERFVRRSKNALKGKYRHKYLDWFLPAKGKESKGFSNRIDVEESSDQVSYVTIKLTKNIDLQNFFYFFIFAWARARMSSPQRTAEE